MYDGKNKVRSSAQEKSSSDMMITSGPTGEGCRPVSATCFKEVIEGWRSFIIYTMTLLQGPSMFP
jgi:hypothetical protein